MSKEVMNKEEEKWKVEDAVRTLMEYQKIMKDKELKEKAIKKLQEKKQEVEKAIKEIK